MAREQFRIVMDHTQFHYISDKELCDRNCEFSRECKHKGQYWHPFNCMFPKHKLSKKKLKEISQMAPYRTEEEKLRDEIIEKITTDSEARKRLIKAGIIFIP